MLTLGCALSCLLPMLQQPEPGTSAFVEYRGASGPGAGKHIVFVTGEEEYRSEEGMPQLAKILAVRHGFRCTVLFAIDPATGAIDPDRQDNIPGLEALEGASLMVLFTRFRDLPDEQMRHIVDYVHSGRPIVALRTSTHAFQPRAESTWAEWHFGNRNGEWPGGFGRQVLGETWIAHHGDHGRQGQAGVPVASAADHPILRGITARAVWDPSDVYAVRLPLPDGCTPLLLGMVLDGTKPDSPRAATTIGRDGKAVDKNDPMMPIAWTNAWTPPGKDRPARVFTTTIGAAAAFAQEGSRRLLVNACFWALGMDAEIAPDLDVALVGEFSPRAFGFGRFAKGVLPSTLALPPSDADGASTGR